MLPKLNSSSALAVTEPLAVGVSAYHALPARGPLLQEGAGSPGSRLAPSVSTVAWKGSEVTWVAFAKSSLLGGDSVAALNVRCPPPGWPCPQQMPTMKKYVVPAEARNPTRDPRKSSLQVTKVSD